MKKGGSGRVDVWVELLSSLEPDDVGSEHRPSLMLPKGTKATPRYSQVYIEIGRAIRPENFDVVRGKCRSLDIRNLKFQLLMRGEVM